MLSWAAFSLAHTFLINWLDQDEVVPTELSQIRADMKTYQITKPEVITCCEVIEPKPFLWSSNQIVLSEEKIFEYKYWIDLTDNTKIEDCQKALILKVDFDIRFDDKETEELYQEHVKTLLDELPEYCKNRRKVTKTIMKIGGQKAGETSIYYINALIQRYWVLQILIFPAGLLKFYIRIFEKLGVELFTKKL